MATSDQRNKWKCEELAAALSGSKDLSALGFVINPNKRPRQRLSQASKHTYRMIPLLYRFHFRCNFEGRQRSRYVGLLTFTRRHKIY